MNNIETVLKRIFIFFWIAWVVACLFIGLFVCVVYVKADEPCSPTINIDINCSPQKPPLQESEEK